MDSRSPGQVQMHGRKVNVRQPEQRVEVLPARAVVLEHPVGGLRAVEETLIAGGDLGWGLSC